MQRLRPSEYTGPARGLRTRIVEHMPRHLVIAFGYLRTGAGWPTRVTHTWNDENASNPCPAIRIFGLLNFINYLLLFLALLIQGRFLFSFVKDISTIDALSDHWGPAYGAFTLIARLHVYGQFFLSHGILGTTMHFACSSRRASTFLCKSRCLFARSLNIRIIVSFSRSWSWRSEFIMSIRSSDMRIARVNLSFLRPEPFGLPPACLDLGWLKFKKTHGSFQLTVNVY